MSVKKLLTDGKKDALRSELDNLMKGFGETFGNQDANPNKSASDVIGKHLDDITKPARMVDVDFANLDVQFKIKSKQLLNSMFEFYLDSGVLNVHEYTKKKKELDTSNLANMLWQLKTVKVTIGIIMDEITSGNVEPKLITALGTMQDKFSDIMRMQANYVLFLEDTYKKIKYENVGRASESTDENAPVAIGVSADSDSEYFLSVDTKKLIDTLEEMSKDDVHEHSDITGELTDPRVKDALAKKLGVEVIKKDDVEEYGSILDMI